MSDWTDGYVKEINYTYGYYSDLSPQLLQTAAINAGFRSPVIDHPFTYCELGCGFGLSVTANAAAFEHGEFYATDFNPDHILTARDLVDHAGITNCHFFNDSFEEFIERDLPAFDFITLHGVYSWIDEKNRTLIQQFIQKFLKTGGIVYISYNALPGWSQVMPLRDLMINHANHNSGPLPKRASEALGFIDKLIEQKTGFFEGSEASVQWFSSMKSSKTSYLAHEYLNKDLKPFLFTDLVEDMANARLTYAGTTKILQQYTSMNLPKETQDFINSIPDATMKETARDYLFNTLFRKDIFMRGQKVLSGYEQEQLLLDQTVILNRPLETIDYKVASNIGSMSLHKEIYEPFLTALEEKPASARDMMALPELASLNEAAMIEMVRVLIGAGYVFPCPPPSKDEARAKSCHALNHAILDRYTQGHAGISHLVSPNSGHALRLNEAEMAFVAFDRQQDEKLAPFIAKHLQRLGHYLQDGNGEIIKDKDVYEKTIKSHYKHYETNLKPLLKAFNILEDM